MTKLNLAIRFQLSILESSEYSFILNNLRFTLSQRASTRYGLINGLVLWHINHFWLSNAKSCF